MPISPTAEKDFYGKRRKFLAKQFYYGDRLEQFSHYNKLLEASLSLFTGGTLIGLLGNLAVPTLDLNRLAAIFSIIAFLLSIVKNIWGIDKLVQRYNELYTTYLHISTELDELVDLVRTDKKISDTSLLDKTIAAARVRKQIIDKEDLRIDTNISDPKILERVNKNLPEESRTLEYIPLEKRLPQTPIVVIGTKD